MEETETDFFESFRNYTAILTISILLIFVVIYGYLWLNFQLVNNFFGFFELTPYIKAIFTIKLENVVLQSTLTDIVIIFAGFFGFFYLLWVMENKGFMVFEGYDIYQKHFQTAFYILALFNFIFLIPIFVFLLKAGDRYLEAFIILAFYLISLGMARWLTRFMELIKNYNELLSFSESVKNSLNVSNIFSDGKEALKFTIGMRSFFSRSLLVLMFLAIFFAIMFNFNILTIFYIILVFLVWYFIICSVTKIPFSLVNIFFNSGDIFNRVFITEEATGDYIVTLHIGNIQKKVMKNTIKYIELSDSSD